MNNKIVKKTIITAITLAFLASPLSLLKAEDYPAGYLGPGHREYLSGKIQNGYYVEIFASRDIRQKERVNKRNEIEKIVASSYEAAPQAANGILAAEFQKKYNTDNLKVEIAKQRQQREQVASAQVAGGFTYIPHSDGKIEYFRDGLLIRVENERVIDQFGNLAIKNTSNIRYNESRLMSSYDATLTDNLGNITRLFWYGASYSGDSVYYANSNTSANKNLMEYFLKEIDPAGNEKLSHWQALNYEGKAISAFHQRVEDAVYGIAYFTRTNISYHGNNPNLVSSYQESGTGTDGLAYGLSRTNISYNAKEQISGYREETFTTQVDDSKVKTTTEAQFKYYGVTRSFGPDVEETEPDNLLESLINVTTETADGSTRTEITATTYNYPAGRISAAKGTSNFTGQEAGGNKYRGLAELEYEVLGDRPTVKQVHSRTSYYGKNLSDNELLRIEDSTVAYNNNLSSYSGDNGLTFLKPQQISNREHTEITYPLTDPNNAHRAIRDMDLSYYYDAKGSLIDARSSGNEDGWEYSQERGWYGKYNSTIKPKYEIKLGKTLIKTYDEDKTYK